MRRALGRLTPKQRTILVLRFYEDMSESQTAAALGIGLGTVKSQTKHALMRLRELAPELAEFSDSTAARSTPLSRPVWAVKFRTSYLHALRRPLSRFVRLSGRPPQDSSD